MATVIGNQNDIGWTSPSTIPARPVTTPGAKSLALVIGRILFSLIFLFSGFRHFSSSTIQYAASQGVPLANFLVPVSGIMAILGAASILLGYKPRIGALLLILFLIPVTLMMHNFWTLTDPMMRANQMAHFMKNVSMLGAALMILYFGSGPYSAESRGDQA